MLAEKARNRQGFRINIDIAIFLTIQLHPHFLVSPPLESQVEHTLERWNSGVEWWVDDDLTSLGNDSANCTSLPLST